MASNKIQVVNMSDEYRKKVEDYIAKMKTEEENLKKHRSPSDKGDKLAIEVVSAQPRKELEILNSKDAVTVLGASIPTKDYEKGKNEETTAQKDDKETDR